MFVQVVAAVIRGQQNTILVSKRKDDSHQGGLWEFPGGKVEVGEKPLEALKREIDEELGITIRDARPLIKVHHHYSDKSVCLDVWEVTAYNAPSFQKAPDSFTLLGREGQIIEWASIFNLMDRPFPAANYPILKAVTLPSHYVITPDFKSADVSNQALDDFVMGLRKTIELGCTLIQLRAPTLNARSYRRVAEEALIHCRELDAKLILNSFSNTNEYPEADGLHLSSRQLITLSSDQATSPSPQFILGASCHSIEELKIAEGLGCDYASLSPILATSTHPDVCPIGWATFSQYVESINMPVYALGGLCLQDLETSWLMGAQGVSGISQFWN